ncbi:MAG: (d)CMP kinase [Verrucomicrobiales bacterium]|nr:(d)CMP kinase [Verrucomicrobiales bacterium]
MKNIAIAIDGPAASGKSRVARRVAEDLGYVFVNSGAMYRAFAWQAVQAGIDVTDESQVLTLLADTKFECGECEGVGTVLVNGVDPGEALTEDAVNSTVSAIATYPEVRERLVAAQRAYLDHCNVVMEGRDIGTVVFADTPYKFYIDASPEVRAQRRKAQGIVDSIADRDRQDSTRKASPLVAAEGAEVVDSSELDLEQVVSRVLGKLREQGLVSE